MASDQNAKLTLQTTLVKELDFQHKRLVAEDKLKTYGLSFSKHGHDGLVITGAPYEVLLLAEDHLKQLLINESLKKQNKENPECSLNCGKVKWMFFEKKADRIWSHRDELKRMDKSIEVVKYPDLKRVSVVCSYSSYPTLKWKLKYLMLRSPVQQPKFNSDQKSPIDKSYHHSLEHDKKGQSFSSVQAPIPDLPFQFQCKRILVYLSQCPIEKIQGVDAIVNAANEDLKHFSGVALSISCAAGQKMNDECIKYVKTYGPLKVSENLVTTAGKLPHRGIIHCVEPKWTGYHQKGKYEIQLHETIFNILRTADKHNFSKIAMPAVSSGIYGGPEDICANVYVRAIVDYSQQANPSYITEVHFADINPGILLAIKRAYENWRKKPDAVYFKASCGGAGQLSQSMRESRQNSVDDAKVKSRSEQLPKNNVVSVTTSGEKDTEIIKLEHKLRELEAKKIVMIKEKRKKELEEKIRQAEEDLRVISGTKQEQSNKSTPPMSSLSVNRDREEIELEQKLRELEEMKVSVLKERKKQKLKEKIKQLEEDLSTIEAVPPKDTQVEAKRCIFCTDVLRNPKKLGCGHEFCSKCFDEAFEFQEACPVCGSKIGEDDDNQQGLSDDAFLSCYNSSDFIENS